MKRINLITVILLFLSVTLSAQETCKVLLPGIDSLYIGECKKGLANGLGEAWGINHYKGNFKKGLPDGDGTCEYADGAVYTGQWLKGLRQGVGKMSAVINNKDTLMKGIWENDKFTGRAFIPPSYKVLATRGVARVKVNKQGEGHEVRFELIDNVQGQIGQLDQMSATSGSEATWSDQYGFKLCNFPFTGRIRLIVSNKLRTAEHEVYVEVEILEPGIWIVEIYI